MFSYACLKSFIVDWRETIDLTGEVSLKHETKQANLKNESAGHRFLSTPYGVRWYIQLLVYGMANFLVAGVSQFFVGGNLLRRFTALSDAAYQESAAEALSYNLEDALANFVLAAVLAFLFRLMNRKDHGAGIGLSLPAGKCWRQTWLGLGVGSLAMGAIALAMALTGKLTFSTGVISFHLMGSLVMFVSVSFAEEVLTRGVMQQTLSRHVHPWLGIVAPSLFFGLMHISNGGMGYLAMVNVVLAGLFLALACDVTGSLYFPIGFHTAWNFVQGNVMGLPVSGNDMSYVTLWRGKTLAGVDWLTGGSFGPEASVYSTLVYALMISILLVMRKRKSDSRRQEREKGRMC